MGQTRLTGPGAGSDKYDILTALAVTALAQTGQAQISLFRLMALITARYNWAQDELSLGQKDMALLWSVDERTAKREIKRLLEAGYLVLTRVGVKGRVAKYRLDYARLVQLTEGQWGQVGPDYQDRMSQRHLGVSQQKVVQVNFAPAPKPVTPDPTASPWERLRHKLAALDEARFHAWFAPLVLEGQGDQLLHIRAPSRFAAQYVETHLGQILAQAIRTEFGTEFRYEIGA